jgi:hypothetical protein
MPKFKEELKVNGKTFKLVKERRSAPMAVYRYGARYLRVGAKAELEKELAVRDKLKEYGFPIPKRFKQATVDDDLHYYIESSIGSTPFMDVFKTEIALKGEISEKSFGEFVRITKQFAEAQLKTQAKEKDWKGFTEAIQIRGLVAEMKTHKAKIMKLYEEVKRRLEIFPFVLTHGDFNPNNLYRRGVIDFENLFYGPAGYDLVTNVINSDYFPSRGDYDLVDSFSFTDEQKKKYFEKIDKFYLDKGLPRVSDVANYFEFCRAVWLIPGRKKDIPSVVKFRKERFIKKFLS